MSTTIWDIETGAEAEELVLAFTKPYPAFVEPEPFDPAKVKLGNRKDPVAIEEYRTEAKRKHAAEAEAAKGEYELKRATYYQKAIEDAALSPITGRILAIGLLYADGRREILIAENDEQEKAILLRFIAIVREHQARGDQLVGFNSGSPSSTGFDASFVARRAMKYGIDPRVLRAPRGWLSIFVDLLDEWRCGDRTQYVDLDTLCRFFGLEGKNGSGAEFARLFWSERPKALDYLGNDLGQTQKLAQKMSIFVPALPAEDQSFLAPAA